MHDEADQGVGRRIQDFLEHHKGFYSYDLNASEHDGEVVLTGIVDTLAEKEQLTRLVSAIPGVKRVENNIAISTDGQITDAEVLEEVMEELAQTPGLDVKRVGAKVSGGRVFLVGHTDNPSEIRAARHAASKARGVREVIDQVSRAEHEPSLEELFHLQVRNDEER
ncbi:MAG: BON domain-containing protein [Bacillota bacterium]